MYMDDIEISEQTALKLVELVVDPTKADSVENPVVTAEQRNLARRSYADSLIIVIHHLSNLASIASEQKEIEDLYAKLNLKPSVSS